MLFYLEILSKAVNSGGFKRYITILEQKYFKSTIDCFDCFKENLIKYTTKQRCVYTIHWSPFTQVCAVEHFIEHEPGRQTAVSASHPYSAFICHLKRARCKFVMLTDATQRVPGKITRANCERASGERTRVATKPQNHETMTPRNHETMKQ